MRRPRLRLTRGRLMGAVGLAAAVAAAVGVAWLASRAPRPVARAWAVGALQSIRGAHVAAWPLAAAGVVVLGWRVARGRRLGRSRPRSARALLACGSALLGLATIEVATVAYGAWAHRVSFGPLAVTSPGPRDPASGEIHLVVLGESSARGVPYSMWLSVGQIVEWQLGRVFPDRRVRVEVLAEDGATLEGALRRLDALPRPPDAVILYSGHNEFAGRFPPTRTVPHYADEQTRLDRLSGWLRRVSPLDRLIQEGLDAQRKDVEPRREERRLVDVPACTPEETARLLADFRARLGGLVDACGRSGSLPILVIPPGNDGDFEPNRSVLDPATPRAEREAFGREFAAIRAVERDEPSRALAGYRSLLARHPEFAEIHFRVARLLERSGDVGGANRHYILARDLDGLPTRCSTAFEDAYRDAAARGDCLIVDGPAVLRRAASRGIINIRVMHDAQHPTLIGYAALAREILGQLRRRGAFGWPRDVPAPSIDPADCAAHFGMDRARWATACYYSTVIWNGSCNFRYEDVERRATAFQYAMTGEALLAGKPPQALGLLDPAPPPADARTRDAAPAPGAR